MASIKKFSKRGFTLIELMIVVVIIGILASLAIYGVQKYVANSKSAEARLMLGKMGRDHQMHFEGETQAAVLLDAGDNATNSISLCPSTGNTVPTGGLTEVAAAKYQPGGGEFADDAGWSCLTTEITSPIYYVYSMDSPDQTGTWPNALIPAADGQGFTLQAQGDLDGDGDPSTFQLLGGVESDAANKLNFKLASTVSETDPEE